ncbi:DUF2933 domain-containing protein [Herbaspirillum sp. ST 5-3]|uniref:DUF2933 domain-containing protein n=1 Tax=Oxalobacteraceae TaxID=75682 RepID=UPI0010A58513|nr:DUF2933 domain-containing protein [Herbaspirillum sp. ST 5-3]
MTHDHEHQHQTDRTSSRGKWVLIGFLAIGAFFLFTEHRAHLFGFLPWLLILACPLMHLFHGHGGHGGNNDNRTRASDRGPVPGDMPQSHEHTGRKS